MSETGDEIDELKQRVTAIEDVLLVAAAIEEQLGGKATDQPIRRVFRES